MKCLTEAEIDLYISIEVSPKSLKLTFEKEFLEVEFPANDFTLLPDTYDFIEGKTFKNIEINNKSTTVANSPRILKIKIKALKEFTDNKEIKIFALEDFDGFNERTAGTLMVEPNEKQFRKELDIVFVNVETQLLNRPPNLGNGKRVGMDFQTNHSEEIEDMLTSFFNQTLIDIKKISKETLDVSINASSTYNPNYVSTINNYITYNANNLVYTSSNFMAQLKSHFLSYNPQNTQYNSSFIIFYFNEGPSASQFGYAEGISLNSRCVVVFSKGLHDTTSAHELLHATGLYHSFNNRGKTTKTINLTDNIMDYSDFAAISYPVIGIWKEQGNTPKKHNLINTET